ncbi:MAG: hypothetical protein K9I68_05760 [Bacteroidales bacterium]|nr:hypothetical protein [Bacteroidales bacterium]MCF8338570.1 hypothetical protein [Bacteroidales bacterium]
MKRKMKLLALLIVPFFVFTACDKDDDENDNMNMKDSVTLNFQNLAPSAEDEKYEGWIITDEGPVSTGKFTVDANGNLSQSTFSVDPEKLEMAYAFVLTIEPVPDDDAGPSAIKILGGAFSGSEATLDVSHNAALGKEFASVSGEYILATPTTNTTDDELSGVWWLDPSGDMPEATLNLPQLPDGWTYEGWAVIDGMPVTSGKFDMVDMADKSAPYSGSDGSGPPFPGEDFVMDAPDGLTFPTDLSGGKVVVSIEPDPDNSPKPFAFKPLIGDVPMDATDHTVYGMMSNVNNNFPTGMAMKE